MVLDFTHYAFINKQNGLLASLVRFVDTYGIVLLFGRKAKLYSQNRFITLRQRATSFSLQSKMYHGQTQKA